MTYEETTHEEIFSHEIVENKIEIVEYPPSLQSLQFFSF